MNEATQDVWDDTEVSAGGSPRPVGDSASSLRVRVDEWIEDHVAEFDPLDWADDEERTWRRKAFDEAAITVYSCDHVGSDRALPSVRNLVVDRANDPQYYELLYRNPRRFLKFSYPLGAARSYGALDAEAASAVECCLSGDTVWGVERPPWRMMDLWNFCTMYGYNDHGYDVDDLLALTNLRRPPSVIHAETEDVYALTHNVLFYHNFGTGAAAFPSEPTGYDLQGVLEALVCKYMARENCDVVAELVLSGVLEREIPPGLARTALTWFDAASEAYGYVPGPDVTKPNGPARDPDLDVGEGKGWEEMTDDEREWLYNYHPTLVVALLARVVERDWDALVAATDPGERPPTVEEAHRLGQLLQSLSEYQIEDAVEQFGAIRATEAAKLYPEVVDRAEAFLTEQHRDDGTWGYWPDERALYRQLNGAGDFEAELLDPVAARCSEVLSER
jgi:hypothetical protein